MSVVIRDMVCLTLILAKVFASPLTFSFNQKKKKEKMKGYDHHDVGLDSATLKVTTLENEWL